MAEDSTHNGEAEHRALTPWLGLLGVEGGGGSCREEKEERIREEKEKGEPG